MPLRCPVRATGGDQNFSIPEHPVGSQVGLNAMIRAVDPGYFQAIGIPLLSGRTFEDRERLEAGQSSVIISQALARQYFPNENPLGKHIHANIRKDTNFEIVGVVGDTLWNLTEPVGPTMYFPILAGPWWWSSIRYPLRSGCHRTGAARAKGAGTARPQPARL